MIDVRVIRKRSEFAGIRSAWERLHSLQADPSPFLDWTWFDTFWAEMDLEGWQPLVLTAWRGTDLIGAAALKLKRERILGLGFNVAAGLENVHSADYSWLLAAEDAEETISALVTRLEVFCRGKVIIARDHFRPDRTMDKTMAECLDKAGYMVVIRSPNQVPVVPLRRDQQFLTSSLTKNMRRNLKRGWKKLEQEGQAEFRVSSSSNLTERLDKAWELESRSWKGDRGTAIAMNPHLSRFYIRAAVNLAGRGKFALFELICGKELVCFVYAVFSDKVLYLLKTSFNRRFAKVSPFNLLMARIVEWAEERGLHFIELGAENSEYKLRWARDALEESTLWAFPRTAAGRTAYLTRFGWKDLVKRIPHAEDIRADLKVYIGQAGAFLSKTSFKLSRRAENARRYGVLRTVSRDVNRALSPLMEIGFIYRISINLEAMDESAGFSHANGLRCRHIDLDEIKDKKTYFSRKKLRAVVERMNEGVKFFCLLSADESEILGFAAWTCKTYYVSEVRRTVRLPPGHVYGVELSLNEEYRGKGYGRFLSSKFTCMLRDKGFSKFHVFVRWDNFPSLAVTLGKGAEIEEKVFQIRLVRSQTRLSTPSADPTA